MCERRELRGGTWLVGVWLASARGATRRGWRADATHTWCDRPLATHAGPLIRILGHAVALALLRVCGTRSVGQIIRDRMCELRVACGARECESVIEFYSPLTLYSTFIMRWSRYEPKSACIAGRRALRPTGGGAGSDAPFATSQHTDTRHTAILVACPSLQPFGGMPLADAPLRGSSDRESGVTRSVPAATLNES